MERLNRTQQKHTYTNQKKCTTTQNKHKKLNPGLVTSYDIRPGLLLTYLDTYALTYSPGTYTGHI